MKKAILLAALAGLVATGMAAPLSPEEALNRLGEAGPAKQRGLTANRMELRYTAKSAAGATAYIFSPKEGKGFAILSADSRAMPVLGYSDSGEFDPQNMPDGLKWMLGMYGEQLENASPRLNEYSASADRKYLEGLKPVAPLMTTKWNQSEPYNCETPKISGVQAPTGCVATSVAQVMNYFKYPDVGEGSIRYKSGGKTLQMNFSTAKFKWDEMLDVYTEGDYTDAQAKAVGTLMKAAGYSVEMTYTAEQSGAVSSKIITAMTEYFKYDPSISYEPREIYSTDEWIKMIHDNLVNVGPIVYNGTSPLDGGHSFVCDGYDGAGYFHINWGWGGMSDGYYTLDLLGPSAQGTGGSIGNFSYSQDAVLNMKPIKGEPSPQPMHKLMQYGATKATLNGKTVKFNCGDTSLLGWSTVFGSLTAQVGALIEKVDGGTPTPVQGYVNGKTEYVSVSNTTYVNGTQNSIDVVMPSLADGEYKVTVAYKPESGTGAGEWYPVVVTYGFPNYAYLTVSNGAYSIKEANIAEFTINSMELESQLYNGRNVKLSLNITNDTDLQLTQCLTPRLVSKGKIQMQGSSRLIVAEPESSENYEWVTAFYSVQGADVFESGTEYNIQFVNQDTGKVMGEFGPYVMNSVSNAMTLKVTDLSVQGVEPETVTVNGKEVRNAYVIKDTSDFIVDFSYQLNKGYFDSEIMVGIYERANSSNNLIPLDEIYKEMPFMSQGDSRKEEIKVSFPEARGGKVYYLRAEYVRNGTLTYLTQVPFIADMSGVSTIEEENVEAEYFTLQGVRISNPEAGSVVIERRGGKTRKLVWK